ncbi:MAG: hypothetical protein VX755_12395 [Pseudomonadota bacterium]|jgi:hypothetical protein|nr:hypothetical protein [Pseudomonadota bacterium]MED5538672.1 hypothetical protein [Pseudomonadota bacterium]
MAYEYVKRAYGVNPVPGARVQHTETKKFGTIARVRTDDNYVHVRFDGQGFHLPCHPKALDYDPVEVSQ